MKASMHLFTLVLLMLGASASAIENRPDNVKILEGIVIPSPRPESESSNNKNTQEATDKDRLAENDKEEKKRTTELPVQTIFYVKSLNGEVKSFDTAFTKEAFDKQQKQQLPQQSELPLPAVAPPAPTLPTTPAAAPDIEQMVEVKYILVGRENRPALTEPVKITGAVVKGTIKEIATDKSFIVVRTKDIKYPESEVNIPLQTTVQFQALVTSMRPGDGINGAYIKEGEFNIVRNLEWQSKPVPRFFRWLALVGGAVFLYILAYVFSRKPQDLIIGEDNRYSTSKFQTVMWFWLVISAYIAIVAHRIFASAWDYIGGVDIPVNLLALSGLSIFTFTAAKVITLGKIEQAAERGIEAKPKADKPRVSDLVRSDNGQVDLGDYQMLVITILALVVYAATVVEFMESIEFRRVVTMPDVDATLLAIFGLGQLAYLGKKAAGESFSPAALESASKTMANIAANVKTEAGKAEKAAQETEAKASEAKAANEAATKAINKAAAEPEAKKAANSAKSARDAADQANAAASTAEASVAEAKKILDGWTRHPDVTTLTKSATDAQTDATKAREAAKKASSFAIMAEESAAAARKTTDGKPT